jgi:enoyl-CoA hydratase/carnithine racemase
LKKKGGKMAEKTPFRVEKEGHLAWLILDRPEKRNTMTFDFFNGLTEHFGQFAADPEVRVVVVRAEGKTFCAGLDLIEGAALLGDGSASQREKTRWRIRELQDNISAVERCRKPVIAAIHGHCIGGGIDLTSVCDIRLASKDAVFSIRETRIGIVADVGTLQRFPTLVGQGLFRELAMTGRDFTAEEAFRIGYVNRLYEDREKLYEGAQAMAEQIAANPPMTVQGVKEVILFTRENGIFPGLDFVAQKNAAILPCEDLKEAVTAFMEKRTPHFTGE